MQQWYNANQVQHVSQVCCAGEVLHSQGDGLAQAMRQVPPHYFTEDFTLSRYGRALAC